MPAKSAIFYGSTEWSIIAAIAFRRELRDIGYTGDVQVALISPSRHLDGITMTGPSATDIGKPGKRNRGIYLEWYRLCGRPYGLTAARVVEPRVAEMIFMRMLGAEGIQIYQARQVAETAGAVVKDGAGNITSVTMTDGSVFTSNYFYDGSICMDVLARAGTEGVHWRIGSEGESEYGESLAGFGKFGIEKTGVAISTQINGVNRPQVSNPPALAVGAAYDGVQAFGPRMQYTRQPGMFVGWDKAKVNGVSILEGYDREQVAFLANIFSRDGDIDNVGIGGGKFQDNGDYILTDATGRPRHWDYARLTYAQRDQFHTDWKLYAARWNYFRAFDPAFAGPMQDSMSRLVFNEDGSPALGEDGNQQRAATCGPPKDEHTDNDYLPRLPYPRETRRPIGNYVVTQMDLSITDPLAPRNVYKATGVLIGGYSMDTHPDMYIRTGANSFIISGTRPHDTTGVTVYEQGYSIPFEALYNSAIPNLMFGYPSCTHSAWGSIRIVLNLCLAAEAAGRAMARAFAAGISITATDVPALRARLTSLGLYVDPLPVGVDPEDPEDPEDPDTPGDGDGEGDGDDEAGG